MSRATDLLKQCIDGKWTLLVEEPLADEPTCVLCAEYLSCSSCPVMVESGSRLCDGTPYRGWDEIKTMSECIDMKDVTKLRAAAQAEKDWLQALYDKLMKEEAA